jgi:Ca-activated chloride channel family protein
VYEGQQVWSKLDPSLLKQVALATGGAYVPVETGTVDMARVYQERIEPVAKRELETATIKQHHPRFQWFIAAALLLLATESWLGSCRPSRGRLSEQAPTFGRLAAPAALVAALVLAGAEEPASPGDLARQASEAMARERYDEALGVYEKLRERHPDLAEIPFNMGVAAYRAGDLARAAEYFDQARTLAADPALQARAAYNQGTTAYRRATEGAQAAQQGLTGLDDTTRELTEALEQYRQAIDADPGDADARANGELTWRLLQQLEELKEQLQQQQQQQGDPQQQDQGDQQQQQGEEQQQGEDQQEQQQGDQGQEQEQPPEQGEGEPSPAVDSGEEDQQPPDRAGQPRQEPPMSREQAERLLQQVRDREQERRDELAKARAARQPPVDKDW